MYTHPEHRGLGHAGAILTAIVTTLHAGGIRTIILNVDQRNAGARRLYETHGFTVHCPFIEGIASLYV
jgi:ribosomal protein S18 acetylase RimI-like enzyme